MVDPVALLSAIGSVLAGAGALIPAVLKARRTSAKERRRAAANSAWLLEVAKDGITPEEAAELLRRIHEDRGDD